MPRKPSMAAIAGCVLACGGLLCLGGCTGPDELTPLATAAQFQATVMEAPNPVIVEFHENGCPACFLTMSTMGQLATEYRGRVRFVRVEAGDLERSGLKRQYPINSWPTVVLFMHGQERQRWVYDLDKSHYRTALDLALSETGR